MGTLTSNTGMAFSKWYDSVHGEPSYQETFEAGAAWQAAQAAQPAPRRLTEAEITLLVEAYYEDVGIAPPDLIRQVEGLIFGDAQPAHAIDTSPERVEKQAGNVQVPVLYQYRWTNPAGENQPASMLEWKPVEPAWNQTVEQKCNELRGYRYMGVPTYEVRGLYAAPSTKEGPAMTLPAPDYQLPWTCDHCGYVGDTGPTHYHPRAAVGHLCPKPATGGQRYYSESTVRSLFCEALRYDR